MNGFTGHERPVRGNNDVWLTPLEIVNALGTFDLDPCGEFFHKTATTIYTENGLSKSWHGRVWLNPPYSEVGIWLDRLAEHGYGIALVFARMDTKWVHRIIPKAKSVFFPNKRISFLTRELKQMGNAGAPSMFLSFGEIPEWKGFMDGLIWKI